MPANDPWAYFDPNSPDYNPQLGAQYLGLPMAGAAQPGTYGQPMQPAMEENPMAVLQRLENEGLLQGSFRPYGEEMRGIDSQLAQAQALREYQPSQYRTPAATGIAGFAKAIAGIAANTKEAKLQEERKQLLKDLQDEAYGRAKSSGNVNGRGGQ